MQEERWVDGVFEAVHDLASLDACTEDEGNILTLREEKAINLGEGDPRGRLNYMVALGLARKPEPRFFGQAKGGTRLFQRDIIELLEFVSEQAETGFSLQEMRGIIEQRRSDLIGQALKEVGTEHLSDKMTFTQNVKNEIDLKCHFSYPLIKAVVLGTKLVLLQEQYTRLSNEIQVLEGVADKVKLCAKCAGKMSDYSLQKKQAAESIKDSLEEGVRVVRSLFSEIQSE